MILPQNLVESVDGAPLAIFRTRMVLYRELRPSRLTRGRGQKFASSAPPSLISCLRHCGTQGRTTHPLVQQGHLPLAAWPVSGKVSAQEAFQTELSQLYKSHGEEPQRTRTQAFGDAGVAGVLNGRQIRFQHL